MIYYFSHIINDTDIKRERCSISSEAGRLRTIFIARAINKPVTIISMGVPTKKGYFRKKHKQIDENLNIMYLSSLNVLHLRYIYSTVCMFIFGLVNFKRNDRIILYNSVPFHVFPMYILKLIFKLEIILEIEELYSSYKYSAIKQAIFNLAEYLGIRMSDKYIVCNKAIEQKLPINKDILVNAGYKTNYKFDSNALNVSKKPLIVYTGRLDYEGGVDVFLKSIPYIKTPCEVVISGSGELKEIIENYKNCSNPTVGYKYMGFLDRSEYEDLLLRATVGINPTRSLSAFGQYSFPSKVYQYLEFGNMVVSSQTPSITEIDNSLQPFIYYYDNDSPNSLANAIDCCLKNSVIKNHITDAVNKIFEKQIDKINSLLR